MSLLGYIVWPPTMVVFSCAEYTAVVPTIPNAASAAITNAFFIFFCSLSELVWTLFVPPCTTTRSPVWMFLQKKSAHEVQTPDGLHPQAVSLRIYRLRWWPGGDFHQAQPEFLREGLPLSEWASMKLFSPRRSARTFGDSGVVPFEELPCSDPSVLGTRFEFPL